LRILSLAKSFSTVNRRNNCNVKGDRTVRVAADGICASVILSPLGDDDSMVKTQDVEIEIRILLTDPSKLMNWLEKNALLIKILEQTDYYFDPPGRSFIIQNKQGEKDADEWLRVRLSRKGDSLCYKCWYRDKETALSLYADEIETPLESGERVIQILQRVGFKEISVVKKQRKSWQYGSFEFDCDDVETLGYFVEIEYKGEITNPEKEKEKIFELLQSIGIEDYVMIDRGYSWMQWNKERMLTQ
jgi:predicted adenylyl cyclase CyaB